MAFTYDELTARVKALRGSYGASVREVACVGAARTLLCVEVGETGAPSIAIAAGIHGDEPAGPWAVLELLEARALDARFAYRVWPCTNPSGYASGARVSVDGLDLNRTFGRGGISPEARAIVTANRDRHFALSLDLHEDCDCDGFYCYDYGDGALGDAVVAAIEQTGLPVAHIDAEYDLGFALPAEAVSFRHGVVLPKMEAEIAALGGLSYTLALARRAAAQALTFETPVRLPWRERVTMHATAVLAAIAAVRDTAG